MKRRKLASSDHNPAPSSSSPHSPGPWQSPRRHSGQQRRSTPSRTTRPRPLPAHVPPSISGWEWRRGLSGTTGTPGGQCRGTETRGRAGGTASLPSSVGRLLQQTRVAGTRSNNHPPPPLIKEQELRHRLPEQCRQPGNGEEQREDHHLSSLSSSTQSSLWNNHHHPPPEPGNIERNKITSHIYQAGKSGNKKTENSPNPPPATCQEEEASGRKKEDCQEPMKKKKTFTLTGSTASKKTNLYHGSQVQRQSIPAESLAVTSSINTGTGSS